MKKMVLCLGFILASSIGFASERFDRVAGDPVLKATVSAFEAKNDVKCDPLDEHNDRQIDWRCLNNRSCGYLLHISCPHYFGNQRIGGFEISVDGYDDGQVNDIQQIHFLRVRSM